MMLKIRPLIVIVSIAVGFVANGQSLISGVVNSYIDVTAINYVSNSVTVSSAAGFSIGDQVVLIQMKGATIAEADNSSFGTINNYNDAGNYEILIVCDILGNEIIFDDMIQNTYTPSGLVQLINMPVYTNATISGGDLTANTWNGTTGGVLALEVTGTLDFGSQNIDVSGLGFRGGVTITSDGSCSPLLDASYYQAATDPSSRGFKGEGIAEFILNKETGRGPQANGGGGGNNHNGGGAGGGNYGFGGAGGERIKKSNFTCGSEPGINSKNLQAGYTAGKIFVGGGGGAGHDNNALTNFGSGEDGGGIVIIRAGTISGNNQNILANGLDMGGPANEDGGGGGGAGGAVFIESNNFSGNLSIDVSGGNGAGTNNSGTSNCNGPGGGGGGGIAYFSTPGLPAGVTVNSTGGAAGTILTTSQNNCTVGSTNQAANGANGTNLFNLTLNESTTPFAGCLLALPVEFYDFSYSYNEVFGVDLYWSTLTEVNNDYFNIYRGFNGMGFELIGQVDAIGTSTTISDYRFNDSEPLTGINYYRLSQVDLDGQETMLETIAVAVDKSLEGLTLIPNPSANQVYLLFQNSMKDQGEIYILQANGAMVAAQEINIDKGKNKILLNTETLKPGVYYVAIRSSTLIKQVKMIRL